MRRIAVALLWALPVLIASTATTACHAPAQDEAAQDPAHPSLPSPAPTRSTPVGTPDVPVSASAPASGDAGERRQTRCGWFENPTPGNAWLSDRDRTWIIGTQGGPQAEGDWPGFEGGEWIVTNGSSYGYGCACMSVTVDAAAGRILTLQDARAVPLSQCRADAALQEPGS
ncbi:DUF4087 domain-containing protein [Marilutibacter chinensis]|uniref:DUF4087 domain-containing protein n=1 Tax=Marilutibacter chinensis TaxID=2912247 RepID=A0ABS9HRG8_9GAMM|nr:DUF4087 domain-containing protein [Lysobacter chinensis]MCF7220687.1 DUF4087 domain-containing protein [Lysobacter chinensis]